MSPKISIIIPVYNAEDCLRETLDSVIHQSLKEIEVICVDDGSTDESLKILNHYADRDQRVRVLVQQNQFAGPARNRGLEAATGEYVHFLDADDRVLDYAYEALYNKAVKYDLDVLRCAAVDWDVQNQRYVRVDRDSLQKLRTGDFNRLVTPEEKDSPLYKISVAPWAGICRRSFLMEKGIRFNDLRCVNDRSFYWRTVTNAERIMVSRDRLTDHRVNQSTSLIGSKAKYFACQFRSVEYVVEGLRLDQIKKTVADRILDAEFRDLFVWMERLCRESPERDSIMEQTEQFVSGYTGPLAEQLWSMHQHTLWRLNSPAGKRKQREAAVYHDACRKPKVSVAVPIFNVEDYLNEALHSLTTQTMKDIEFLCVNDGSTDGSLTILKEYAALDGRIRILDGPNGGYGKAMNRAIDAASGEYLGILEPDDFVPAKMFNELYRIAKANDAEIVKADFYRFKVNADGSLKEKLERLSYSHMDYNRIICPVEEPKAFRFIMNTWSGIYRLEFLNRWNIRHNETPGASYQDNGFWFQTFCRAERVYFTDRAYYRNRRDNPFSSMFNRGKLYCITEEYRFIKEKLDQNPDLAQKVLPIYYWKKFSNSMVTYHRLAPEYQLEYLRHIRDEFAGPMRQGLLDREVFGEQHWRQVHEIVADPDAYHAHICVSVIIPAYNAQEYIRQALDSILVRNEISFEVICVDDGSTDATPEILQEYADSDPRVRVITQKNAGAGAARNNGMQYARGEYLSFLDADDFFDPEMLRRAYDRAHTSHADIMVFQCDRYVNDTGEFLPSDYTINQSLLPAHQPFSGSEIQYNVFKAFVGWAWDKLFRTDFVRENHLQFQEQRTTNDMLFVFSAIVKADRIVTLNRVLAHHRLESGSLSVTREQSWQCCYHALCALRQQLRDWDLYDSRERDFISYSLHFLLWNLNTLKGEAYFLMADKLKQSWLADLGIPDHLDDETYFYNPEEYQQLWELVDHDAEELLFRRIGRCEDALANEKAVRKRQSDACRIEEQEQRQQIQDQRQQIREQRNQIKELKSAHRKKLSELKKENKKLSREIEKLHASATWKIGRVIVWIPGKIRKLFRKG